MIEVSQDATPESFATGNSESGLYLEGGFLCVNVFHVVVNPVGNEFCSGFNLDFFDATKVAHRERSIVIISSCHFKKGTNCLTSFCWAWHGHCFLSILSDGCE